MPKKFCTLLMVAQLLLTSIIPVCAADVLKVGFIMVGPVTDMGWNQAHNEGRLYLEKTMKDKVQTVYAENIPESAEAARVMEKMIAQGVKMIFSTSYGYLEPMMRVAEHHPEVTFMQTNRQLEQPKKNIAIYRTFVTGQMYVAGIVAGRMTKTNNVGYILGHPVPHLLGAVNAFTLGAHSVNPKVIVHVVSTNSWDDPSAETEATKGLIERGVDIMVSILDSSLTVCLTADKAGAYSIGTEYDLNKRLPRSWLTGSCFDFGPFYAQSVQSVIDGSWKPGYCASNGIKDSWDKLASFGKVVPVKVKTEALQCLQKIKDGKLVVFRGPIKDAQGKLRVPVGKTVDDLSLSSIDWVVPGVECALTKK